MSPKNRRHWTLTHTWAVAKVWQTATEPIAYELVSPVRLPTQELNRGTSKGSRSKDNQLNTRRMF